MNFFGKYYVGYLLVAFVIGLVLSIVTDQIALFNFAVASVFLWVIASIIERLVDDFRHLYREFWVAFDVMELVIFVLMSGVIFANAFMYIHESYMPSWILVFMVVLFFLYIVLSTMKNYLLKPMVHYEWDSKFSFVKRVVDKIQAGEKVDVESLSMSAKLLHLKWDMSLRKTAILLGKSPTGIKYYLNRKDKKLVI